MNNREKAAEVIRTWQARHKTEMDNNPDWAAQNLAGDLAAAGRLAPDLPEPTTIAEGGRGATWGRDVQVWVEDGGDRVWVGLGDMTVSHSVESARKHGNRLLAAANLAERNQE